MATIYVSGERVYITLYFILLFVTMFCIYRMADAVEEKLKQTGGKLAVTLLALICLINIGCNPILLRIGFSVTIFFC